MNRLFIIILPVLLSLLSSCASLNFISNGNTPFQISANEKSELTVEIENHAEFYFWGNSPPLTVINLVDEGHQLGLNTPAFVTVEQSIGWKNLFLTVFSLGLYAPVDYKITVLSAIDRNK